MTTRELTGEVPGTAPYRAPRGAGEETLCSIFAEVLRRPRIGIDDDFFDLGGRSIDGVMIAARSAEALGCRVSLADLFDAPTVAELYQQVGGTTADDTTVERTQP